MRELTSPVEQSTLAHFAAKGSTALEIGSYDGASAIAMAKVTRFVHCVDPFIPDPGTDHMVQPAIERFLKNTRGYSNIVLHYGKSYDVLPVLKPRGFQFVFIDGAHFYEAALFDIAMSLILCDIGGHIAVHDTNWPEVQRAITASKLHSCASIIIATPALYVYQRSE